MLKNLFEIRGLGRILLSAWTWRLVHLLCLVLLLVMAAYGWRHHAIPGVPVKDPLMYTNLATYFFWVLWIMGVVFVALLFGRGWCSVCPLGWLNGLVSRFGLKLALPGWLGNFVPVTLTLVALQLAVYFLAVHRYPDLTASLLALMILLAVLAGLLFRKRAFCTLLCPAGAVFGLYARVAPFQLRVADPDVCACCESRDCISGKSLWRRFTLGRGVFFWETRRPDCPVDLVPAAIEDSATCTLCLHCARNCEKGNILLGRRPWLEDLGKGGLSPSETLFFLVLFGMLTANFSKVYVELREAIFWVPQKISLQLGWEAGGFYLLAALWVALVLPLLLMLPGYLALRLSELTADVADPAAFDVRRPAAGSPAGFWTIMGRLALPFIPLVLAAHVVLAVVKLNAKGGYLPYVLADPTGVRSYLAMNVMHTVQAPGVLIPLDVLKWIVLTLVAGGYLLSLAAARRAGRGLYGGRSAKGYLAASAIGVSLVASLYGAIVIRWLFIR
jgi:hypothetical protein